MKYWVDVCLAGIAIVAVTVAFCSPSGAQRGQDEARNQCRSEDTTKRLVSCTIVINAKGYGSKFELAAAYDARCWAFNDLQQYQRGLADCKAAIALQPKYSYAYQNLGVSLIGLGDFASAITAFNKAIELKPNFIYSYLDRAKAFIAIGNREMAQRDLQFALTIDPTSQGARDALSALNNPPIPAANEPQPRAAPPSDVTYSGTGFFVSLPGYVLTNQHVIDGCRTATLFRPGYPTADARIVASDATNDLALLMTNMGTTMVSPFRIGARVGESVFVYGFPLPGLLSSSGNFTPGSVTSVAGLGDDSRIMQISAPVQGGNSGGPLLDKFGNVVGIVVAKLNALRLAEVTHEVPQNVNFAIKASIAANFLEVNNIQTQVGSNAEPLEPTEVHERAKQFTVQVACKPAR